MIQEKLDEYVFHRTYLRDQPLNVFIMLRLLAQYGREAVAFWKEDHVRPPMELSRPRRDVKHYYRAEECLNDPSITIREEHKEENYDDNSPTWELDENNNLVIYDNDGNIQDIHYSNPENEQMGDYERVEVGGNDQERLEILAAEVEAERFNIDEIDPSNALRQQHQSI